MPLGNEELREEGRTGAPDLAGAPGIIEATVVAEGPVAREAPDAPRVVDLRTTPAVAGRRGRALGAGADR
jgi:hypothetical protein